MNVDPGASVARTRLAWRRTAVSGAAVPLLAARSVFHSGGGVTETLATAVAMVGWVALVAVTYRRMSDFSESPARAVRAVVAVTLCFAALGVPIVLF